MEVWNAFAEWVAYLFASMLTFWPSTPSNLKLSALLSELQTAFPAAPWYVLYRTSAGLTLVVSGVTIYKALRVIK